MSTMISRHLILVLPLRQQSELCLSVGINGITCWAMQKVCIFSFVRNVSAHVHRNCIIVIEVNTITGN